MQQGQCGKGGHDQPDQHHQQKAVARLEFAPERPTQQPEQDARTECRQYAHIVGTLSTVRERPRNSQRKQHEGTEHGNHQPEHMQQRQEAVAQHQKNPKFTCNSRSTLGSMRLLGTKKIK